MNIKQKVASYLVVGLVLAGVGLVFSSPSAQAAECGGVKTSIINCTESNKGTCSDGKEIAMDKKCSDGKKPVASLENNGVWGLLLLVLNIMTAGVGIVAVGGIVYGSILYASAGGSTEQVKKAIGVIRNVVIGLIAFVGMYAFLNFLIPGGIFT